MIVAFAHDYPQFDQLIDTLLQCGFSLISHNLLSSGWGYDATYSGDGKLICIHADSSGIITTFEGDW